MTQINKSIAGWSAMSMLCLSLAASALADEVVLANGDRISGKVVRKETSSLVFKTPYAGNLNIEWSEIRRITTDEPISLYFEGGSRLVGTMRSDQDGSVIVTGETVSSGPIPLEKLQYINPSPEISGDGLKVSGHVNAGYSSTAGNSETTKFYLDSEGVFRTRDNRFTLGARGAQAEDEGVETESSWLGYGKYDHFISKNWYAYANGNFENDRFKDIRLRTTLGLGSGYQFYETDKTNLALEGGITYVNTDAIDGEDDSYPAARLGLKFDRLLYAKLKFFHSNEAYISLDDADEVFVRSQTGLRVPLVDKLNATAQYNIDWDSQPSAGRDKTDRALLLTLGYSW